MTIKGLQTDEQGLARAGIIRLGYKAKKCKNQKCGKIIRAHNDICPHCNGRNFGKEFPREAPCFILDDAPGVAEAIEEEFPKELKVYFLFDDIDQVFPAYMHQWSASSLVCRGDGEQIAYAINPQTGKVIVKDGIALEDFSEGGREFVAGEFMPCPGMDRNLYPKCANCKPHGLLLVMLRDIPRLAYYQISTTSARNIREITSQLNTVRNIVGDLTGQPKLTGVPIILKRVKKSTSAPRTDKAGNQVGRQRVDHWFIDIEIEPEWISRMVAAQRKLVDPLARFSLPIPESPAAQAEPQPTRARYAEPPMWESQDFEPADEDSANIIDGVADEVEPDEVPNGKQANGKHNPADDNGFQFPSDAARRFWELANENSGGYYDNPQDLLGILGGKWFNFANQDAWDEKMDYAVSMAKEAGKPEQESPLSEPEAA